MNLCAYSLGNQPYSVSCPFPFLSGPTIPYLISPAFLFWYGKPKISLIQHLYVFTHAKWAGFERNLWWIAWDQLYLLAGALKPIGFLVSMDLTHKIADGKANANDVERSVQKRAQYATVLSLRSSPRSTSVIEFEQGSINHHRYSQIEIPPTSALFGSLHSKHSKQYNTIPARRTHWITSIRRWSHPSFWDIITATFLFCSEEVCTYSTCSFWCYSAASIFRICVPWAFDPPLRI